MDVAGTPVHREPFASLDAMLAPEALAHVCGRRINFVARGPFTGGHSASGSSFLAIETNHGSGPRFVVKRSSPETDWIVRGTGDERGREVAAWTSGLLDRLPPEISHPIIGCAWDGAGWAILMRDVSEHLIADPGCGSPLSQADNERYLDALAALHVAFWEQPGRADPARGFCSPWHRYTVFSPATGAREIEHPNEVVRCIREGWEVFWTLTDPEVASLVRALLADPTPLCVAMARYPQTVVHGDPRDANIGIVRGAPPRVVLIDWHLTGPSTPGSDLAWYLWDLGIRLPVSREATTACYRDRLARRLGARFDDAWWQPQMELSLLGQLVRGGWANAWDAVLNERAAIREWYRQDLAWWCTQARAGARWL
jgi:hypothetical protein